MGKHWPYRPVADRLLYHTYRIVYVIKPIIADSLARSRASGVYIRQQTKSSRVYNMSSHLSDTKSLSEPTLTYPQ